jgi:hypothetical protein
MLARVGVQRAPRLELESGWTSEAAPVVRRSAGPGADIMTARRRMLVACVAVAAPLAIEARAQVTEGEFTYAVEVNGVVCGYSDVRVTTSEVDGRRLTVFEQDSLIMLSALGSRFNTTIDLVHHIDPETGDFSLMRAGLRQGDLEIGSEIRVEDRVAHCSSTLVGDTTDVELDDDVELGNPLYNLRLLRTHRAGTLGPRTVRSLDAREFRIQEVTFTPAGEETLELGGEMREAFIVDILSHTTGIRARVWLDTGTGMVLKTQDPRGQTTYLSDPSVKKRIELANVESSLLAKTNVSISDIHRISSMRVEAELEPTGAWLSAEDLTVPGQRFTGTVVENRVEGVFEIEHPRYDGSGAPAFPPPPVADASLREHVEPGPFVESDDAAIVALARGLTAGSADSWEAAVRLSRWVADNISYEIPGGGTAARTLEIRAGECGSHSLLLAALCRSVGIPARLVWGCMYTPNNGGSFGQHAWTEVHMGDAGWIPVDCTAHEIDFVDSGHIRLGEGVSMSISVNARRMEVLEHALVPVGSGVEADPPAYAPYVGRYEAPGGAVFEARVADGRLAIVVPSGVTLAFNDPDETGRWSCAMTDRLFCRFTRDGAGAVRGLELHEIVRMRRIGPPAEADASAPTELRPYLGEYRFPGSMEPMVVLIDDGRLTARDPVEKILVHLSPTGEAGRWIDEYDKNTIWFEHDEAGAVTALVVDAVNVFPREE